MNNFKPMAEWNETELRAEAEKRLRQYQKATERINRGYDNCIGQDFNYMQKYAKALYFLRENGHKVSEEENEVICLMVKRG